MNSVSSLKTTRPCQAATNGCHHFFLPRERVWQHDWMWKSINWLCLPLILQHPNVKRIAHAEASYVA